MLSITSESESLENSRKIAYNTINKINWKHGFYRKDIGKRENSHRILLKKLVIKFVQIFS